MTALAADTIRIFEGNIPDKCAHFQVLTATTIYEGSAVCAESAVGYARPVAASLTSPEFYGFAEESVVNSGASGAKKVKVRREGVIVLTAITGMTGITNIGDSVYMSDDGTGFTSTSTNNVLIGKVGNYVDSKFLVDFQAISLR